MSQAPEPTDEETTDAWGDDGINDGLVDILAHFDIIEDLVALWYWLCGVKSYQFSFSRLGSFRGIDVERLLRRHGIRIWDRDFDRKNLSFRAKLEQAKWAEYLMARKGVPLTSSWFYPRHANIIPTGDEPPAQGPPLKAPLWEVILGFFLD